MPREYRSAPGYRAPAARRPGAAYVGEDDGTLLVGETVFEEDEAGWTATGLLDAQGAQGAPILGYTPGKDPIGFLWHDERGALRPRDAVLRGAADALGDAGGDDLDGEA